VRERQVNTERTRGDSEDDNMSILRGGGCIITVADLKEYNIRARNATIKNNFKL
jgi:hypothetical protein